MTIFESEIQDVKIIILDRFLDDRGWFSEIYSFEKYKKSGIDVKFVQENHSMTLHKNTIRGLHFQSFPKEQSKLVRCIKGKILDIAVDLRPDSDTFKKWVAIELTENNKKQIFIPKGFAHGFLTLTDNVEIQYLVDEYYSPDCDKCIRFDDHDIGIEWGTDSPTLSKKDAAAPFLKDVK